MNQELLANWMWRLMAGMTIDSQEKLIPVAARVIEWMQANEETSGLYVVIHEWPNPGGHLTYAAVSSVWDDFDAADNQLAKLAQTDKDALNQLLGELDAGDLQFAAVTTEEFERLLAESDIPEAEFSITAKLGAEIVRLWVASTDYSGDLNIDDKILARVVDGYRRIRNTLRFLLANTSDFDPATEALGTGPGGEPVYLRDLWPDADALAGLAAWHFVAAYGARIASLIGGVL